MTNSLLRDPCKMFDSAMFNDIAKSYLEIAVKEMIKDGLLTEEQGEGVQEYHKSLFDEIDAKTALKICGRA